MAWATSIPDNFNRCWMQCRHTRSADGIAASLQACANGAPIGIGPRAARGGALIDLLLGLLGLRLGIGIRCGPDDGSGGTPNESAGAGVARTTDDGADDRSADGAGHGA